MKKIEKLKKGERASLVSILVTAILALAKTIVGFFSGSIILIVDALHSGTDILTGLASWFGLKISEKKPTEKFPYGFYKTENLATFFISLFILYTSVEFMLEGYSKLFSISKILYPFQALAIALISSISSFFLARYLKKSGEVTGSQSLIANAQERLSDVASSLLVFVGIFLTFYSIPYVEGIITILISILVLKIGIFTAKDSLFALLDVSPGKEIEEKVRKLIDSIAGVEEFKDLKLRRSGPFVLGEVTIKIRKYVDVEKAHEIADLIEEKIKSEIEQIDSFIIHIEPFKSKQQKIAIPLENSKGLKSKVMQKFGRSNYFLFAILDTEEKKIKGVFVKPNPYKLQTIKAGLSVSKFLVKEKIDALLTKEIGEIAFHTLKSNIVDIYKAEGETAEEVIKKFLENKLERLNQPTKKEEVVSTIPRRWGRWRRRRGPWWRRIWG